MYWGHFRFLDWGYSICSKLPWNNEGLCIYKVGQSALVTTEPSLQLHFLLFWDRESQVWSSSIQELLVHLLPPSAEDTGRYYWVHESSWFMSDLQELLVHLLPPSAEDIGMYYWVQESSCFANWAISLALKPVLKNHSPKGIFLINQKLSIAVPS